MERGELLKLIKAALQDAFGGRLKGVVLYGSEARGEAGPDSDVDLLVLLDEVPEYVQDLVTCIEALYPCRNRSTGGSARSPYRLVSTTRWNARCIKPRAARGSRHEGVRGGRVASGQDNAGLGAEAGRDGRQSGDRDAWGMGERRHGRGRERPADDRPDY